MKKALRSIYDAFSFLTILPVSSGQGAQAPAPPVSLALGWFPLVGAFIGLVGGGVFEAALRWWSHEVAAFLSLLSMAALTGGLHLDGFADTMDGLFSLKKGKEAIAVMQQGAIGALGACALFFLLGLKWSLLAALPADRVLASLVVACALSRWLMVVSAGRFGHVPGKSGLGRWAVDSSTRRISGMATLLALSIVVVGAGWTKGLVACVLAVGVGWFFNRLCAARLGGVTGDTLGAVGELSELSSLFWFALP